MTVASNADISIAILAGGRGSRMGVTKDRLSIAGRPILLHLLNSVRGGGPTLLVTSRAHPEPLGFEAFDQVVFDPVQDAGPLAGIAAAVGSATTPLVAVLSVDMPHMGGEQIHWLADHLIAAGDSALGVMSSRWDGDRKRIEPFPSVYRREAADVLSKRVATPAFPAAAEPGRPVGRSLHSLLEDKRFHAVDATTVWPAATWLNLNRPEDLVEIGANIA